MSRKRILIVDDDHDLRKALRTRFKAHGYETVFACDGYSATKVAKEEEPDLIILDIGLPAGDGFIVLERLQENPATEFIPVIVLTARHPGGNKERALRLGAKAFFQKPADNMELLTTIEETLGEGD
jgi:DNA-binding response OmpR family regulator